MSKVMERCEVLVSTATETHGTETHGTETHGIDTDLTAPAESVVWDVYRALCGALTCSDRTEVWTMLTHPRLRLSETCNTEDLLFQTASLLVCALRDEAAGFSPAPALKLAHKLLSQAVDLSFARVW